MEDNLQQTQNPQSLKVPQKGAGILTGQAVKDIMTAYSSQSKVRLYEDEDAMNGDLSGVKGKNIPLEALRPSRPVVDGDGNVVESFRGRNLMQGAGDIANAYRQMKGLPTDDGEEGIPMEGLETPRRAKDLSGIERFTAEYVEDMPNDDEGLLEILALAIRNAKANLEMLESLYAALSPVD